MPARDELTSQSRALRVGFPIPTQLPYGCPLFSNSWTIWLYFSVWTAWTNPIVRAGFSIPQQPPFNGFHGCPLFLNSLTIFISLKCIEKFRSLFFGFPFPTPIQLPYGTPLLSKWSRKRTDLSVGIRKLVPISKQNWLEIVKHVSSTSL